MGGEEEAEPEQIDDHDILNLINSVDEAQQQLVEREDLKHKFNIAKKAVLSTRKECENYRDLLRKAESALFDYRTSAVSLEEHSRVQRELQELNEQYNKLFNTSQVQYQQATQELDDLTKKYNAMERQKNAWEGQLNGSVEKARKGRLPKARKKLEKVQEIRYKSASETLKSEAEVTLAAGVQNNMDFKVEQLKEEVAILQQQLKTLRIDKHLLQQKYENDTDSLTEEVEKLRQQWRHSEAKNFNEKELDELRSEVTFLNKQLKELGAEKSKLEAKLFDATSEKLSLQERFKKDVMARDVNLEKIKAEKEDLLEKVGGLQLEISLLNVKSVENDSPPEIEPLKSEEERIETYVYSDVPSDDVSNILREMVTVPRLFSPFVSEAESLRAGSVKGLQLKKERLKAQKFVTRGEVLKLRRTIVKNARKREKGFIMVLKKLSKRFTMYKRFVRQRFDRIEDVSDDLLKKVSSAAEEAPKLQVTASPAVSPESKPSSSKLVVENKSKPSSKMSHWARKKQLLESLRPWKSDRSYFTYPSDDSDQDCRVRRKKFRKVRSKKTVCQSSDEEVETQEAAKPSNEAELDALYETSQKSVDSGYVRTDSGDDSAREEAAVEKPPGNSEATADEYLKGFQNDKMLTISKCDLVAAGFDTLVIKMNKGTHSAAVGGRNSAGKRSKVKILSNVVIRKGGSMRNATVPIKVSSEVINIKEINPKLAVASRDSVKVNALNSDIIETIDLMEEEFVYKDRSDITDKDSSKNSVSSVLSEKIRSLHTQLRVSKSLSRQYVLHDCAGTTFGTSSKQRSPQNGSNDHFGEQPTLKENKPVVQQNAENQIDIKPQKVGDSDLKTTNAITDNAELVQQIENNQVVEDGAKKSNQNLIAKISNDDEVITADESNKMKEPPDSDKKPNFTNKSTEISKETTNNSIRNMIKCDIEVKKNSLLLSPDVVSESSLAPDGKPMYKSLFGSDSDLTSVDDAKVSPSKHGINGEVGVKTRRRSEAGAKNSRNSNDLTATSDSSLVRRRSLRLARSKTVEKCGFKSVFGSESDVTSSDELKGRVTRSSVKEKLTRSRDLRQKSCLNGFSALLASEAEGTVLESKIRGKKPRTQSRFCEELTEKQSVSKECNKSLFGNESELSNCEELENRMSHENGTIITRRNAASENESKEIRTERSEEESKVSKNQSSKDEPKTINGGLTSDKDEETVEAKNQSLPENSKTVTRSHTAEENHKILDGNIKGENNFADRIRTRSQTFEEVTQNVESVADVNNPVQSLFGSESESSCNELERRKCFGTTSVTESGDSGQTGESLTASENEVQTQRSEEESKAGKSRVTRDEPKICARTSKTSERSKVPQKQSSGAMPKGTIRSPTLVEAYVATNNQSSVVEASMILTGSHTTEEKSKMLTRTCNVLNGFNRSCRDENEKVSFKSEAKEKGQTSEEAAQNAENVADVVNNSVESLFGSESESSCNELKRRKCFGTKSVTESEDSEQTGESLTTSENEVQTQRSEEESKAGKTQVTRDERKICARSSKTSERSKVPQKQSSGAMPKGTIGSPTLVEAYVVTNNQSSVVEASTILTESHTTEKKFKMLTSSRNVLNTSPRDENEKVFSKCEAIEKSNCAARIRTRSQTSEEVAQNVESVVDSRHSLFGSESESSCNELKRRECFSIKSVTESEDSEQTGESLTASENEIQTHRSEEESKAGKSQVTRDEPKICARSSKRPERSKVPQKQSSGAMSKGIIGSPTLVETYVVTNNQSSVVEASTILNGNHTTEEKSKMLTRSRNVLNTSPRDKNENIFSKSEANEKTNFAARIRTRSQTSDDSGREVETTKHSISVGSLFGSESDLSSSDEVIEMQKLFGTKASEQNSECLSTSKNKVKMAQTSGEVCKTQMSGEESKNQPKPIINSEASIEEKPKILTRSQTAEEKSETVEFRRTESRKEAERALFGSEIEFSSCEESKMRYRTPFKRRSNNAFVDDIVEEPFRLPKREEVTAMSSTDVTKLSELVLEVSKADDYDYAVSSKKRRISRLAKETPLIRIKPELLSPKSEHAPESHSAPCADRKRKPDAGTSAAPSKKCKAGRQSGGSVLTRQKAVEILKIKPIEQKVVAEKPAYKRPSRTKTQICASSSAEELHLSAEETSTPEISYKLESSVDDFACDTKDLVDRKSTDDWDFESPLSPDPQREEVQCLPKIIPLEVEEVSETVLERLLNNVIHFPRSDEVAQKVTGIFKYRSPNVIARLILNAISKDVNSKVELFNARRCPHLSITQCAMLGLLLELQEQGVPNLLQCFLAQAEDLLLRLRNPVLITPVARVHGAICKFHFDYSRMRFFICKAFAGMGDAAVAYLYVVIKLWVEVMPQKSAITDKTGEVEVRTIVQLIRLSSTEPQYNRHNVLLFLKQYYGYEFDSEDSNKLLADLLNCYIDARRKDSLVCLIVALCRKVDKMDIVQNLNNLKARLSLSRSVHEVCDIIKVVGMAVFHCQNDENTGSAFDSIRSWLEGLSDESPDSEVREASQYVLNNLLKIS